LRFGIAVGITVLCVSAANNSSCNVQVASRSVTEGNIPTYVL